MDAVPVGVHGEEGAEDEGEAVSFLVDLHSYTPGMKISF